MKIHLVIGPMFSGKSSFLFRKINECKNVGKRILVINHTNDSRCGDEIKTHDSLRHSALKVSNLDDIDNSFINEANVIIIDEAQFFMGLKTFVEKELATGKTILLAGLDGDYKQRKFGELLDCIPLADEVTKLTAMCMDCLDGTQGPFTKRIVESKKLELVGGDDMYKAVCRRHL